ncbi:hypothetical protein CMK18_21115, partial [Candidatus Poribacteria bacterium]|nr:hypothetical protein [Candidatus Poribacteria bacterium]
MKVPFIIFTNLKSGWAERALFNLLVNGFQNRFESIIITSGYEEIYGPMIKSLGVPTKEFKLRKDLSSLKKIK